MSANGSKLSKLDRFLSSANFFEHWPNTSVTVLARIHSDHCPILLDLKGLDFGPIPFIFFNSWLQYKELDSFVTSCWNIETNAENAYSKVEVLFRKPRLLKKGIK